MGQRANLVIVKHEGYELYYNHWCANTIHLELFWGAQHSIAFIELQSKVDNTEWLDDIWAEGGVVIDEHKKLLLFYGGDDELCNIPYRKLFLKLMQTVWVGWELCWAYDGIVDIAGYVGVSAERVMTSRKDDLLSIYLEPPENIDWVDTIASIQFEDGELLIFPLYGGIEGYLLNGPRLIQNCNKAFAYRHFNVGESVNNFPTSGFHLDITQKKMDIWHADVFIKIAQRLRAIWQDWEICEHYDQYEIHNEKAAGKLQLPVVDNTQLLLEIKTSLLRTQINPLDTLVTLVKKLEQGGKQVKVSPHAFKHEDYEVSEDIRESILNNAVLMLESEKG